MAVAQSTYLENAVIGRPGMIANGEHCNVISRFVEDAAGVAFGRAVFQGTADDGVTATPSANLIGIVVASKGTAVIPGGVAADIVPQRGLASIATDGPVWVTAGANVNDRDQVYVTSAGAFNATASGNTILTGWQFDMTAVNGAPVRIVRR